MTEKGNNGGKNLVPKCVPDCGKPCKNGGICEEDKLHPSRHYCKCPDKWTGPTCEEKACIPACAYGECKDGACVCPEGVTGDACDNRECKDGHVNANQLVM